MVKLELFGRDEAFSFSILNLNFGFYVVKACIRKVNDLVRPVHHESLDYALSGLDIR